MAHDLNREGRSVLDFRKTIEIQTPLMTREIIDATVNGARTGTYETIQAKHDVTPREVIEYALKEKNGYLTLKDEDGLWNHFADRGLTRGELQAWLREWENKEFVVMDVLYQGYTGR